MSATGEKIYELSHAIIRLCAPYNTADVCGGLVQAVTSWLLSCESANEAEETTEQLRNRMLAILTACVLENLKDSGQWSDLE